VVQPRCCARAAERLAGALDAFEHAAQHTDTKEQAQKEIAKIRGAAKPTTPERMPVERIPGTGQGYNR
jgi:hypothetical protein